MKRLHGLQVVTGPRPAVVSIDAGGHRAKVLARRDELVAAHMSLVDGIARAVARSLPSVFLLEDLIAVGYLALIMAATRYRPGDHNGTPFSAYARLVVRGAIVESTRRKRWTEATRPSIDAPNTFDNEGSKDDLAITYRIPEATSAMRRAATQPTVEVTIDAMRLARRARAAVNTLPEDQRQVVALIHGPDGPTFAAAARRLAIPQARVREIYAAAIEDLRARLAA